MITSVKQQADVWVHTYGDILRSTSINTLHELHDQIITLSQKLSAPTETLEQLQSLLTTIVEIRDINMNMEIAFQDITERFRTLKVSAVEREIGIGVKRGRLGLQYRTGPARHIVGRIDR